MLVLLCVACLVVGLLVGVLVHWGVRSRAASHVVDGVRLEPAHTTGGYEPLPSSPSRELDALVTHHGEQRQQGEQAELGDHGQAGAQTGESGAGNGSGSEKADNHAGRPDEHQDQ